MFTGIVEEVGTLAAIQRHGNARRLTIEAERVAGSMRTGDSLAVDGVCLTVVANENGAVVVDVIGTTLSRTTLGRLERGSLVNLERALALGDRLGGHLVQGHVDGVGEVVGVARDGEHVLLTIRMPDLVADVTVLHGSITVQGVSLTVSELPAAGLARVALIPYTWRHTALRTLEPGHLVNLEGDMIGRFVMHYLKRTRENGV